MNTSSKLLVIGGLVLALCGMGYGLYYALFDEHQTLEMMGDSLGAAFSGAAERRMPEAHRSLDRYALARFEYVRGVDVHSHWTALAMLMIVLGVAFHRLSFQGRIANYLAAALLLGSATFPFGVILQTINRGAFPKLVAAVGSALLIAALGLVALVFARGGTGRMQGRAANREAEC